MTPAILTRVPAYRPVLRKARQPYMLDRTAAGRVVIDVEEGWHLYRCTIPSGSIDLGIEVVAESFAHAKTLCQAEARRLYGYQRLRFVKP